MLVFSLFPVLGNSQDKSDPALPTEISLASIPVVEEGSDSRKLSSLRDSLRQLHADADNKPYRLSEAERQRLREQLRSQNHEATKK